MPDVTVVVEAVNSRDDVAGLAGLGADIEVRFADTVAELRAALPGADVLFGFDFKGRMLPQAWDVATDLRWIQWAGAGVDALLFPELVDSAVRVTNASGIYDEAIAEHVLAMMLAHVKGLATAIRDQDAGLWKYRTVRPLAGSVVVVLGAGGIGRAIARLLGKLRVEVILLATSTRSDEEFGQVVAWDDRDLSQIDWLVVAAPLTAATAGLVDASILAELPTSAVVINVGRGASLDEAALAAAIEAGRLAGAGLDVFETEPLPSDSPLWGFQNVIITPHHAGDVADFPQRLGRLFLENLARYRSGRPLINTVDKQLGYRSLIGDVPIGAADKPGGGHHECESDSC